MSPQPASHLNSGGFNEKSMFPALKILPATSLIRGPESEAVCLQPSVAAVWPGRNIIIWSASRGRYGDHLRAGAISHVFQFFYGLDLLRFVELYAG